MWLMLCRFPDPGAADRKPTHPTRFRPHNKANPRLYRDFIGEPLPVRIGAWMNENPGWLVCEHLRRFPFGRTGFHRSQSALAGSFHEILTARHRNFASEVGTLALSAPWRLMSSNEQSTARCTTQIPSFQGVALKKEGQPEMTPVEKPFLGLARKLHDNETALAFMRNAFRMFQRIG